MQPADSIVFPYQLLSPLSPTMYADLKASIAMYGILVPVELDDKGNILDGHHRIRAWTELRKEGVNVPEYDRLIRSGMSEAEKAEHIYTVNALRRHLSKEGLLELRDDVRAQRISMRQDGSTLQQIAKATGTSIETARKDALSDFKRLKSESAVGQDAIPIEEAEHPIINARGQVRPAKYESHKPQTGYARNKKEQARVTEALKNTGEKAQAKTITPSEAREASNHPPEATTSAQPSTTVAIPGLRLGRFQEALADVTDASVDLIFTDPPYAKAFLAQWSDLSALAARVLKPSGMFVAYSGQTYLPEVMARLSEHLQYWWLGAIWHGGSSGMVLADQPVRKIVNVWKPLLFYVRPGFVQGAALRDGVEGQGAEKDAHGWQQSVAEAEFYIRHLCPDDGLVVDPCLGGGTTAIAAMRLLRQFIGAEENENAYHRAVERIGHEREARS